jgi:hypothetical protein
LGLHHKERILIPVVNFIRGIKWIPLMPTR